MVERLLVREYLSFDEVILEFRPGLVVFTGPSGAGKSILIDALLALFGLHPQEAKLSEMVVALELELEKYGIQEQEVQIVRAVKKEKARYFLNDQTISKKALSKLFEPYVRYLGQKDLSFFESPNILLMLDDFVQDPQYPQLLRELEESFKKWTAKTKELKELEEKEQRSQELKEFLEFEIHKIASVEPQKGEYEELMQIKKELSKKEKIAESISEAEMIFEYEGAVSRALEVIGANGEFFESAMNELREILGSEKDRLEELDGIDVKEVLDRLEQLSTLKRRYGSIENALEELEKKRAELERLENLFFEKEAIRKDVEKLAKKLEELAGKVSQKRQEAAKIFEEKINGYLAQLRLPMASIELKLDKLTPKGWDKAVVHLGGVTFKKISSGEYNRLRLAFLVSWSEVKAKGGILILDEIDANISGEESMAVAKILQKLAKNYQIFAISHQAQLASRADQHFLVTKEGNLSKVEELGYNKREEEIARIISGETIAQEARDFAKKLLKERS